MTLGPFLRFLCYVLGTKLGGALPLRMRHKGMQLVLGRLAGHKTDNCQFYSRVSEVTLGPFFGVPVLRFGHEIGCCFAVADASQSYAACPGRARWK